jgi:hypothetical protein
MRICRLIMIIYSVQPVRCLGTRIPLTKNVFLRAQDGIDIPSSRSNTIYKYIQQLYLNIGNGSFPFKTGF